MKNLLGFTLVELLIVVTILAITATIVIPNIKSTDPARLDLAAEYYASAIRFARSESIRTGVFHGFVRNDDLRVLRVKLVDSTNPVWSLGDSAYDPLTKQIYHVYLTKLVGAEHISTLATENFIGTCNTIRRIYFDTNGSAWCIDPNTVKLIQYDITLTLGSDSRVVSLDGITGRVSIQ